MVEIGTGVRGRRIEPARPLDRWLEDLLTLPELRVAPVTAETAPRASGDADHMPGDAADRIILATAEAGGYRLAAGDEKPRANAPVALARQALLALTPRGSLLVVRVPR